MSDHEIHPEDVRRLSDKGIRKIFDTLIAAKVDIDEVERALEEFDREYSEPEPLPPRIGTTGELINYHRQQQRYAERREAIENRKSTPSKEYLRAAKTIAHILPEGHTLDHAYTGWRPDLVGSRAVIEHRTPSPNYHKLPDDPPLIEVKSIRRPSQG